MVLDSYDLSLLGWEEGHENRRIAVELLNTHNPNEARLPGASLLYGACSRTCRAESKPCPTRLLGAEPEQSSRRV